MQIQGASGIQSRMSNWIQRIRAKLYYAVGPYPDLFFPIWRISHPRADHHVHAKTQIVIEGYPRSSNSFADAAFRVAQLPAQVHQAHHIHLPAQVIRGVKRGLPCVVLIRPPEDAVSSTAIYDPANSLRQHLRDYIRFYRAILPYEAHFITALFDDVIRDFGQTIRHVNQHFNTTFADFDHTEANEEKVLDVLHKEGRRAEGDKFDRRVAMPNAARKQEQTHLKAMLKQPEYQPLLEEAQALYRTYEGFARSREA
ncbi:MAG: hypothetical protein ACI9TH_001703 [Kiritimatiellia bacterium]